MPQRLITIPVLGSPSDRINMHLPTLIVVTAQATLFIATATAAAQESIQIGDNDVCQQCAIEIALREEYLPSNTGAPDFQDITELACSSDGSIYAAPTFQPETILRVSGNRAEWSTIGQAGGGPGEFRGLGGVRVGRGDTLYTRSSSRIDLFAPDGGYVRSMATPGGAANFLPLRDGIVIVNRAPRGNLSAITVHSAAGNLIATAELPPSTLDRRAPTQNHLKYLQFAESSDGTFWACEVYVFRCSLFNTKGKRLKVLTRTASWFPEGGRDPRTNDGAMLVAATGLADGRLAVLVWTMDRKGMQLDAGSGERVPRRALTTEERKRRYRYRLEVLDPDAGKVTSATWVEDRFLFARGFLGGQLYEFDELESGLLKLRLWSIDVPMSKEGSCVS